MRTHETVTYSGSPPGAAPVAADSAGRVSGVAVVYGTPSLDRGGYRDVFARGSLRIGPDVTALLSHDASVVLGRTTAGTLQLSDQPDGVHFGLDLPDTQAGRDLLTSLKRGDVSQCSFSALVLEEDWDYDRMLRTPVRTVLAAELLEVSIVPLPAFPSTTAQVVD
jgi:HK97 family phage prohead protease